MQTVVLQKQKRRIPASSQCPTRYRQVIGKERSALQWHQSGSIDRYRSSSYRCLRAICEWMRKIQMRLDKYRNFPRKRRNDMANLRNPRQYQDWTEKGKRRSHRNAATKYRYSDRKRSTETIR